MPSIEITQSGDFSRLIEWLKRIREPKIVKVLREYAEAGVKALADNTPKDSGITADSWSYDINYTKEQTTISFNNDHFNKGVPIAIILQYGHGTGTGGWVEGRDYINPAIRPIFDSIAEQAWREVTSV